MSGSVAPTPPPQGAMPGGAMPPGGAPTQGQPPMGSSPATGPSQNLGMAAKGMQAVGAILNSMAIVIPLVGPGSPIGQALAKAVVDIGKHVAPGSSSPQGEQEFAKQLLLRQAQMGSQQTAMASQAPHPPGQMPGGGAAQPMMAGKPA